MIARYTNPEMGAIWSDQRRFETWLEVELAAADAMAEALAGVDIKTPEVPVVANVLAEPITDPEAIRKRLIEQVTGMVRWRETMQFLGKSGVGTVYEVGTGRVLAGIARRFEGIQAHNVGTPDEVEAAAAELGPRHLGIDLG